MMRGVGTHEVIIESPKHLVSTSELSEGQIQEVLRVYRDRLVDLKKDPRLVYGMIFKIDELSGVIKQVIAKIEQALDRPAYNYIVHTAPFDTQDLRHYHWHIETMPSLTMAAGFEWGTGFYGNPVVPEEAAALLRMVEVEAVES